MGIGGGFAQEEAALISEPKVKAGGGERGERERVPLRPAVFREGFLAEGTFRRDLQE